MQGNDHKKSRVSKYGQHQFTSSPCSQPIPNPQRDLTNTQDLFPHFARVKTVRLFGAQTRPHDEYESCRGIHLVKDQQRPFSSPRCLLFPLLRQAPVQPYLLQFASRNAQLVEIMRPSKLSATSQTLHRFKRYRPPSTGHSATHCMFMGTPQLYLLTLVFPPCISHRACSSPNSDSGCTPSPSTLFSIFQGNCGSPYYKLCPWTHLDTACRLQSVTWTWLSATLPPLCHKT